MIISFWQTAFTHDRNHTLYDAGVTWWYKLVYTGTPLFAFTIITWKSHVKHMHMFCRIFPLAEKTLIDLGTVQILHYSKQGNLSNLRWIYNLRWVRGHYSCCHAHKMAILVPGTWSIWSYQTGLAVYSHHPHGFSDFLIETFQPDFRFNIILWALPTWAF